MSTPFISTDDLGETLGQDVSTSELAVIALDSACEIVRGELNLHVNLEEDEEVLLDGTGTDSLLLPELPVRDVTEVSTFDDEGTETALTSVDWLLDSAGILWMVDGTWPKGHHNVAVTYSHGWDLTEDVQSDNDIERVPSDIRMVALRVAKRLFVDPEVSGSAGAPRDAIGGTGTWAPFAAGELVLEDERRLLSRWRRPR